jgi:hypothetical protein
MTARRQDQRPDLAPPSPLDGTAARSSGTADDASAACGPPAGSVPARAALLALMLVAGAGSAGCATTGDGGGGLGRAGSVAQDAMTQPLRDFGLVRPVIAPELARIVDPYAPPMGPGCAWLLYELGGIETVLGTETSREGDRRRTSGEQMGAAAEGAVRGAVSDLIPARGLVRQLSGAEAADRALRAAQERGRVRRAFLMGLAHADACRRPPPGTATPATAGGEPAVIAIPPPVALLADPAEPGKP